MQTTQIHFQQPVRLCSAVKGHRAANILQKATVFGCRQIESSPTLPPILAPLSLPTLETCPFRPPSLPAGEGQSPRALPSRQFQSPLRRSPPRHVKTGDLRGSGSLLIRPTWSSLGRLLVVAMNNLANANSQFALDLFQKLNEAHPTGNIFFSPVSISSSLAMILLGARDNTAAELSKTLHFDGVEDLHSGFHRLNTKINRSNAPYILTFANRLYGEKTFNFLSDFLTSTQNLYGAELATVDFSNAPDKAKNEINQWVEQQTEGKIPELLSEGSINEMTKLVLVSAVYFKGSWAKAFKEEDTEDKPFRLNKTEKKNVKMMFMKEKLPFGYIPECKCRVLELPYNGEDLSMIILLPDEIEDNSTGLEQLEKQLTLEKLQEWTQPKNMNSDLDVYVHLPKFQLEENYDLKSYFAAMGLLDVFDSGKANLSGMSGAQDLHVSKIVHKSFLEVNEVGTEAAAATAATIMLLCLPIAEEFNADHPFLFFIRHKATNTILFLGRFVSP